MVHILSSKLWDCRPVSIYSPCSVFWTEHGVLRFLGHPSCSLNGPMETSTLGSKWQKACAVPCLWQGWGGTHTGNSSLQGNCFTNSPFLHFLKIFIFPKQIKAAGWEGSNTTKLVPSNFLYILHWRLFCTYFYIWELWHWHLSCSRKEEFQFASFSREMQACTADEPSATGIVLMSPQNSQIKTWSSMWRCEKVGSLEGDSAMRAKPS